MGGSGWGGVGSVAIMYLRGAHGLDAHLVSPSSDTCSLHPRLGQDGRGGGRVGCNAIRNFFTRCPLPLTSSPQLLVQAGSDNDFIIGYYICLSGPHLSGNLPHDIQCSVKEV